MRTTLESGAWIEHRPLDDLKVKDGNALTRVTRLSLPEGLHIDPDRPGDLDFGSLVAGLDAGAFTINQRDCVIARIVTAWSFTGDDGELLPVPQVEGSVILHQDSIGEIPLADGKEIETLIAPYLAKLRQRPDPKGGQSATTSSSNGSSRAKAPRSPRD